MDGVQDRIGEIGLLGPVQGIHGAQQGIEIAVAGGNQDRDGIHLLGQMQRLLGQAQHIAGTRLGTAAKLIDIGGIDADSKTCRHQSGGRGFEMGKGCIRQAAEVDDIGAVPPVKGRALEDCFHGEARRLDDLGENPHVLPREVGWRALAPEELGEILKILRPTLYGSAVVAGQGLEIAAKAPGQQHPIGLDGGG